MRLYKSSDDIFLIYSTGAVEKLSSCGTDVASNLAGETARFCYINSVVLGMFQPLCTYPRVLYIDIDCHHNDGVKEAFHRVSPRKDGERTEHTPRNPPLSQLNSGSTTSALTPHTTLISPMRTSMEPSALAIASVISMYGQC